MFLIYPFLPLRVSVYVHLLILILHFLFFCFFLCIHPNSASSSLPVGSLTAPPLSVVTPETLEAPSGGCGSLEDFEMMVGDLRRTFVSWLRHTEAELKRERNVRY